MWNLAFFWRQRQRRIQISKHPSHFLWRCCCCGYCYWCSSHNFLFTFISFIDPNIFGVCICFEIYKFICFLTDFAEFKLFIYSTTATRIIYFVINFERYVHDMFGRLNKLFPVRYVFFGRPLFCEYGGFSICDWKKCQCIVIIDFDTAPMCSVELLTRSK